ncbi:glycosyltransferase [Priestia megaterium]|uniref:glycosyltransferase n=1 Tax=Priestia megaterium TaxID=1404 RepID=UPI0030082418
MKLMQINSVYDKGSTGRITRDIHSIALFNGIDSKVLYGRGIIQKDKRVKKISTNREILTHLVETRVMDRHGFGSKKSTLNFIKEIEEFQPDILHLHNIHGYYLNVFMLFEYIKKTQIKVVWTLHDCWPFTGHCAYFDYARCEKWKTECSQCPEISSYPSSILKDNSKGNFHNKKKSFTGMENITIVTPSKWLKEKVKGSFLKKYPVFVINNGIDLKQFKKTYSDFRDANKLKDKFIILGVASVWDRRKGLDYFVELAKKIQKDEIIVLVGLSSKQIEKLPENIIGISKTENIQELASIYSTADVFINPTLEDNFPTTNLESLACGTPVITFNTGGSVESIFEGCGYIVDQGDVEAIRKKINLIKQQNRIVIEELCIQNARKYFEKDINYNKYIDLYKSI